MPLGPLIRRIPLALLAVAVAVTAGAIPSSAGAVTVSMGDSYSSGEGAGGYDAGTDDGSPVGGTNRCHRTSRAWPRLMGVQEGHHLACSGAKTVNLDKPQGDRFRSSFTAPDDVGQLERLRRIVAQGPVERVLVGLGGNDAGFSKIVQACRLARGCLRDQKRKELPRLYNEVRPNVAKALGKIRAVVGDASEIVLVGYPDVIPQAGKPFRKCDWIDGGEKARLRILSDELDSVLDLAASDARARFVSIRGALAGHELCTKDSWVKPITSIKDRTFENAQQMAHPTAPGQQAIRRFVEDALRASGGVAAPVPVGCRPATSVAAIVDDSGSMETTDPLRLRRRAMELLITKPGGTDRTLGAVEFGENAGTLFAPGLISQSAAAMMGALDALQDDGADGGGSTNYDAGFDASGVQQPTADARVFLTDGAHNEGSYLESHAGGPRTYVIGLGIRRSGADDAERLGRIASETGGQYFSLINDEGDSPEAQALRLAPTFNTIDALLDCRTAPSGLLRTLQTAGSQSSAGQGRFLDRRAIEIVLTWGTPDTDVDISAVTARSPSGRVLATLAGPTRGDRKRRKLVTNTVEGATFDTVTVARPNNASTVAVQIRATTLGAPTLVSVQIRPADPVAGAPATSTVPAAAAAPKPATPDPVLPPPATTSTQTAPPPPPPPPPTPPRRVLTVDNRVTNGSAMREDPTPVRLTTRPEKFCGSRGCNINGTERVSGQTYDAATCQIQGERTTNGNDSSAADDANPERFESTRYYGVRLASGVFGYVSEVWIRGADRGGLGLPGC